MNSCLRKDVSKSLVARNQTQPRRRGQLKMNGALLCGTVAAVTDAARGLPTTPCGPHTHTHTPVLRALTQVLFTENEIHDFSNSIN